MIYEAGKATPQTLVLRNEDQRTNYASNNAVVIVPEAARLELPEGFNEFGPAGAPLWVLQQSQIGGQPFLGLSTEGIPSGVFQPDVQYRLLNAVGPGHFFAWQATEFGVLDISFNSRDGLSDNDIKGTRVGTHEHLNWGFTSPGLYYVTLQVALESITGESVITEPASFLFAVEPLPPLSLFESWQCEYFPNLTDASIIGPTADPDHDGQRNLVEFFAGSNPNTSGSGIRFGVEFSASGEPIPFYITPADRAPIIEATVVPRDSLNGPDLEPLPELTTTSTTTPPGEVGEWVRWSVVDQGGVNRPQRFYVLHLRLR